MIWSRRSEDRRIEILQLIGEKAKERYNQLLVSNPYGYDLHFMKDALEFSLNPDLGENLYYLNTGSRKGNRLALYFEYGTGLYTREKGTHKYKNTTFFKGEPKTMYYKGKPKYNIKVNKSHLAGALPGNKYITPRRTDFMKFKSKDGKWIYAKQVSGVRPGFYMIRAVHSAISYAKSRRWIE